MLTGLGEGVMRFLFFAAYAVGYWYGVELVLGDRDKEDKEYTPAVLMIVSTRKLICQLYYRNDREKCSSAFVVYL